MGERDVCGGQLMGIGQDEQAKMVALERRRKEAGSTLLLEAVQGGFIVQRPCVDYGSPTREVVSSPEALVATVQRWAKEATER